MVIYYLAEQMIKLALKFPEWIWPTLFIGIIVVRIFLGKEVAEAILIALFLPIIVYAPMYLLGKLFGRFVIFQAFRALVLAVIDITVVVGIGCVIKSKLMK